MATRKWLVAMAALGMATLTAADAAAQTGPAWIADIHDVNDEPAGGPLSLTLVGARNGGFSGKVAVAPEGAADGISATITDLKQGAAVIPASRIRVRYGMAWEPGTRKGGKFSVQGQGTPSGCDILLEAPPTALSPGPVPVWITVEVPKDAQAGAYTGELTIKAKSAIQVPVKLEVADWTLPDPQNYRTWLDLTQSPDTLQLEYGVPMWSDQHWAMIARSLRLIAPTGSRVVHVPLIARTNFGNEESMVRWVKQGDKYTYDFAIMEKYLDLVQQHLGKPKIIELHAWEIYLKPPDQPVVIHDDDKEHIKKEKEWWLERAKISGPAVTVVDGGKTECVFLPVKYSDPAAKAQWEPLWKELRQRLERRGWWDVAMLGTMSDHRPSAAEVKFLQELSGDRPWTSVTHHARWLQTGKAEYEGAKIGYTCTALDFQYAINPAKERLYGWKKPILHGLFWRFGTYCRAAPSWIRQESEANITGNQRGIAHLGADYWPCIKDKRGRKIQVVVDRYLASHWHSLNTTAYMLAPGPDGPVGTARLEVLREGIQECEARIAIEEAILAGQLKGDLAQRAQAILDQRQLAIWKARGAPDADLDNTGVIPEYRKSFDLMYKRGATWDGTRGHEWFLKSNWQERARQLFAVAAEAAGGK